MTAAFLAYFSPICLFLMPFVIFIFGYILRNFLVFKSKIDKLGYLKGSPYATHINESIDGITTVRTFKKIAMFEDKF